MTASTGTGEYHVYLRDNRKVAPEERGKIFGDRIDSPATFPKEKLSAFAGKPVRLEFVMPDADLYSFRF